MTFSGFSEEGLSFLSELGTQDKAFLDANRGLYEAEVAAPAKAFVTAMGEALAEAISPAIVAVPKVNGSISPINNDLRFSQEASPYKDHLLFRFWEGSDRKTAPTLFVRLHQDSVGFASGAPIASLELWRRLVDDAATGTALSDAIAALGRGRRLDVAGQGLKRVPKPYAEDHVRAELLKHKWLQVRWAEPAPASIHRASFVGWCTTRLEHAGTVHRWLVEHRP